MNRRRIHTPECNTTTGTHSPPHVRVVKLVYRRFMYYFICLHQPVSLGVRTPLPSIKYYYDNKLLQALLPTAYLVHPNTAGQRGVLHPSELGRHSVTAGPLGERFEHLQER